MERTSNPLPFLSSYKLQVCTSAAGFMSQLSSVLEENNTLSSLLTKSYDQMSTSLNN